LKNFLADAAEMQSLCETAALREEQKYMTFILHPCLILAINSTKL